MATLLDLANLSKAVYDDDARLGRRHVVTGGWTCIEFRRAAGLHCGFQGAIFVRGGETVVSFRGTAQAMDGVADLKLGTGMNSSYFADGERLAALAANSSANVIVTGHSLGGAIAQVVANRGGYVLATFNAPGVGVIASRNMTSSTIPMNIIRSVGMVASSIRHPRQAISDMSNAFRTVRGVNLCLQNDIVSRIGNHYGWVLRVQGTGINPATEHGIDTVISVLEHRRNAVLRSRLPSSF